MKAAVVLVALLALLAACGSVAPVQAMSADVAEADEAVDMGAEAVVDMDEDEADDEDEAEDEDEADADEEEADGASFLETEDEVEADDEADAEEEAEADAGVESSAAIDSESAAEAELAAAFDASMTAAAGYHVYSDAITEKAHEAISQKGLDSLPPNLKALYVPEKVREGTIWNDMPSGSANTPPDITGMAKDGHLDIDTWLKAFFRKGPEKVDELVHNVHYLCLQHFHSMAPIMRSESGKRADVRTVFTNAMVKNLIIDQMRHWWRRARQFSADPNVRSHYVGHMLHAAQDSFPRGHVVRGTTATKCGGIISFQGYDCQHGNDAHKMADYSPSNKNAVKADTWITKRYNCAIDVTSRILKEMAECFLQRNALPALLPLTKALNDNKGEPDQCNFDRQLYDYLDQEVYYFDKAEDASRTAGGTRDDFASAEVKAGTAGFKAEDIILPDNTKVKMWNPASTQLWNEKTKICGGPRALQSEVRKGWVYGLQGFSDFACA